MNWYCVHSKAKKENSLVRYLEGSLGLEVCFPQVRSKKVIRRVRREIVSPLFPRYVFCRFDLASHFRAVKFSTDSLGLVTRGGLPIVVDDEVVAKLEEQSGDLLVSAGNDDELRYGDDVRVLDGPFQGMKGTVLKDLSEGARVAILISILNSEVKVVISRSQILVENG